MNTITTGKLHDNKWKLVKERDTPVSLVIFGWRWCGSVVNSTGASIHGLLAGEKSCLHYDKIFPINWSPFCCPEHNWQPARTISPGLFPSSQTTTLLPHTAESQPHFHRTHNITFRLLQSQLFRVIIFYFPLKMNTELKGKLNCHIFVCFLLLKNREINIPTNK